jgi:MoaA/NifB/PqqE/SkfB family radical SAM enzyme
MVKNIFFQNYFNGLMDITSFLLKINKSYRPLIVVIEPTYKCNLRCKSCNLWNIKEKSNLGDNLTISQYKKLFKELRTLNIFKLVISGGEPFLKKDINKIIKAAKNNGLSIYITTNGTLLNREKIKFLIKNQVDEILFSLDSPNQRVHDRIRGVKGTFERVITNIKILDLEKKKNKYKKPRIIINSVISKYNINQLNEIFDLFKNVEVEQFSFYYPTSISNESLKELNSFLERDVYSKQFYNLNINPVKRKMKIFHKRLIESNKKVFLKTPSFTNSFLDYCIYPWIATIVSPSGNIYPCTIFDRIKMGNIKEKSLKQIWNSREYILLRKGLLDKKLKVCKECTCGISINNILTRLPLFL